MAGISAERPFVAAGYSSSSAFSAIAIALGSRVMRPRARAALERFSALLSAAALCRILHAVCVGVSADQDELPANVITATAPGLYY